MEINYEKIARKLVAEKHNVPEKSVGIGFLNDKNRENGIAEGARTAVAITHIIPYELSVAICIEEYYLNSNNEYCVDLSKIIYNKSNKLSKLCTIESYNVDKEKQKVELERLENQRQYAQKGIRKFSELTF